MQASFFPNRFAGKCSKCGARVGMFTGICFKGPVKGFLCGCPACFPSETSGIYAERDAKIAKEQLLQDQLEAKRLAAVAEKKALIAKLGIALDAPFDSATTQYAYSDYSEWKVPFKGDGTDAEFKQAVATPSESLYGHLRASAGRALQEINREQGYLVLSETVQLCD